MLPSEFYSSLSKDLTMLLTDTSDYNMIITVGEEPDAKKYYVHSNILRVRSKYFSKAVSADWARKENGIILFSKPNIESDVFDIILRFIYGGKIHFTDKTSPSKIFDCLKAADELCLDEFLDYAQNYLLEQRKEWLKDNLFILYRDTFSPSSLTQLQEYCINQIRKYPLKLFNSSEFITLPNVCLEELVQDELLEISELQLFEKLIEWGIANTEDLNQTNINKFSDKDYNLLSVTLDKLLKHIRFYHMDSNDFYLRVTPLKAVLGTNFYDEMEVYHNKSTTTSTNGEGTTVTSIPKPKKFINLLPNRGAIISKIMNLQQGARISSWIDKKDLGANDNVFYNTENNPYNFKLLLRGSKDGLSASSFHSKVKKCRSTITLFKLKNHDDFFIGGYNPDEWDSPYWPQFKNSSNAFLFSFSSDGSGINNNNQRDEDIIQPEKIITDNQGRIARIRKDDEKFALNLWRSTGPSFGKFDILMHAGSVRLKHNSYVPNVIPLQDCETYKIEDYEVFEVTQKVEESAEKSRENSNEVVVEIPE